MGSPQRLKGSSFPPSTNKPLVSLGTDTDRDDDDDVYGNDEMMMMRRRRSPEVDGKEKEMAEEEMEE